MNSEKEFADFHKFHIDWLHKFDKQAKTCSTKIREEISLLLDSLNLIGCCFDIRPAQLAHLLAHPT